LGARYSQRPSLFLDDKSQFFRNPLESKSLRAVYLDAEMRQPDTADIALRDEILDPLLHPFLAQVAARSVH
jgi:hypothetical protein